MPRTQLLSSYFISAALVVAAASLATLAPATPAVGQEADGCSHFTWDVSHELAVMKQTPKEVTAATQPGAGVPQILVDTLYDLKLGPQAKVTYGVPSAKPTLNDSAQGGLVSFRTEKAGLYRVSITSGHWIDVVDGSQLIKSKDFQGSRGCARPHKIVEFELPAHKALTLQLSGSTDASVIVSVTPVAAH